MADGKTPDETTPDAAWRADGPRDEELAAPDDQELAARRARFEAERLSRRAALRRIGVTVAGASLLLLPEEMARAVVARARQAREDRAVARAVAGEFQEMASVVITPLASGGGGHSSSSSKSSVSGLSHPSRKSSYSGSSANSRNPSIPWKVDANHLWPNGSPTVFAGLTGGQNVALSATSTPVPKYGLPSGYVELVTIYWQPTTVPVDDEFGQRLGSQWAGSQITENGHPLTYNGGKLASNGTYQDPVGIVIEAPDPTTHQPPWLVLSTDTTTINSWTSGTAQLPTDTVSDTSSNVEVAGYPLDPPVVNRQALLESNNIPSGYLTITWP